MKLIERIQLLMGKMPEENPFGILAEFDGPGELAAAARQVRDAGYRRFDVYTPYPVHGMDRAMGVGRSVLPWIALGAGITGCMGGLAMQLWISAEAYPLVTSGKPLASIPAFIPVTFELTVLLAAFGAFFGMLFLNLLPMLYHPLLKSDGFARASSDGFFLSVEARDPRFDAEQTHRLLESAGGKNIELLEP